VATAEEAVIEVPDVVQQLQGTEHAVERHDGANRDLVVERALRQPGGLHSETSTRGRGMRPARAPWPRLRPPAWGCRTASKCSTAR
jgi:hypothetical protein